MDAEYRTYLFEYYHDGAWWNFEMKAASQEDAIARVKKLPLARFVGTVEAKYPAHAGLWVRFLCWWRNRGISKDEMAGIWCGLKDVKAGRVRSFDEIQAELRRGDTDEN